MDKESSPTTVYESVLALESQIKQYKLQFNSQNKKVTNEMYRAVVRACQAVLGEIPVTATLPV